MPDKICHFQIDDGSIFSRHVGVNQWSDFFLKKSDFFFLDINRGISGGDFAKYTKFCFKRHTLYKDTNPNGPEAGRVRPAEGPNSFH